jgi:L-erythro-3,5-diaminohexanoate dehydrogenase
MTDRYGVHRSRDEDSKPIGQLPQQAFALDPSLPIKEDELLIEVESLNIDSASFHQISEAQGGDLKKIEAAILDLVQKRGKHHNPVTGSGGMLIGKVKEVGSKFPTQEKPVKAGDRIATLVSLTLTPLKLKQIKKIHAAIDRVDVEGHAILFSSGIFARLPSDLPENVSLAVFDVCGAPAQTRKIVKEGDTVVVIGGGGKSGVLCLAEAKRKSGVKTIAIDYSKANVERLKNLSFVDEVIQGDARQALEIQKKVEALTRGKFADVVINVANVPETEMSSILCAKTHGTVYFFSMATSFTRAALGAEGVGADVEMLIGNGYTIGHADLALDLLRENTELLALFKKVYT